MTKHAFHGCDLRSISLNNVGVEDCRVIKHFRHAGDTTFVSQEDVVVNGTLEKHETHGGNLPVNLVFNTRMLLKINWLIIYPLN